MAHCITCTCIYAYKLHHQKLGSRTRQPNSHHTPALFFNFASKLRNFIYFCANLNNRRHIIQIASAWRAGLRTYLEEYVAATALLVKHYTDRCRKLNRPSEDAVSYVFDDTKMIIVHGAPPPTNLLLVCKQTYHEASDDFWSTTGFKSSRKRLNMQIGNQTLYDRLFLSNYVGRL
jgi:hypothetical protein